MTVYSPKGTNTGVAVVVLPGGHLVAATSTHFDKRSYPVVDAADKESCRPDFVISLYLRHLWYEDRPFVLNPNVPVTTNTPPEWPRLVEKWLETIGMASK